MCPNAVENPGYKRVDGWITVLGEGLSHEEWCGPSFEGRIVVCKQNPTLARSGEDHGFISMGNISIGMRSFW